MRFLRTISAFLIFICLPKLVFADQLDGLSGMGELFFGLGVVFIGTICGFYYAWKYESKTAFYISLSLLVILMFILMA